MKEHDLKTVEPYFSDLWNDKKTFELRKDDREYQVGDILNLKEFDGLTYGNKEIKAKVTHILRNAPHYSLSDGYCIMSLQFIQKRNGSAIVNLMTVCENVEFEIKRAINRHLVLHVEVDKKEKGDRIDILSKEAAERILKIKPSINYLKHD